MLRPAQENGWMDGWVGLPPPPPNRDLTGEHCRKGIQSSIRYALMLFYLPRVAPVRLCWSKVTDLALYTGEW